VSAEPLRLRLLLERLGGAEVEYVLVGGLANLEKLDALLKELGGKVEVGDRLLEGSAIKTFLRTGDRTLVVTELGRVDILQGLPQVPAFSSLDQHARTVDIDGLLVRVCSLEDLLEMKRASDRPRDRDDLEALEAARGADPPGGHDAD
jgi:hypothetical protein